MIVIDTREQEPLAFERLTSVRGTLQTGDYSVAACRNLFSIERKTVPDLVGCSMGKNLERFERELHRLRVTGSNGCWWSGARPRSWRASTTRTSNRRAVLDNVWAFEVRSDIPIVFVPTAQAGARLVERWVFYFARETLAVVNDLWRAN